MTIYNGLFEPKKSAIKDCGAVQLAIAIDAPNKKVAESIMTGKLWESYPANGDNYFKPKLWEHVEGQPLPTVGQFDESFAQQHTFDGEKWVSTAQDSASGSSAGLPADDEVIDLMTVSAEERFAAVLLFSTAAIDGHLYSQVVDYLDNLKNHDGEFEEEDRFNFNVLCALQNNFPVQSMHVEGLNNLVQGIFSYFENQTPGKAAISQFVKRWLENPGKRDELAPGVYKNTASNVEEKEEVPPPVVTDTQAKQAREKLNDMGYGVYASGEGAKPEEKLSEKVKTLVQDVDQLVERINREENLPKVSEVVQSINEMQATERDNLELWKSVFKTDERFTTAFSVNGGGTSINGTYMTMMATREFGPKGQGWGVDILEERFDTGAPITRTIKGTDGNNTWELIPDGMGGILMEKHHVIKIRLWYLKNDVRGEEFAFGCTPYIYGSKYGPICDGEATKKSLTDATKKALSGLGFSGDIFMGLYDNAEYRQKNKAEFDLKNASETAEDAARLRKEFDDKLTRIANTLANAVSVNEINKVFAPIARELEVHRKDAESKSDTQHSRHLSSRLRRLTDIKNGRIAELNKSEEKA